MTKKDKLIRLMRRREGVSLAAAAKGLAWQPHTVRAAISRLKKEGLPSERITTDKGQRYVIAQGDAA